jgi:hypothetical protein
MHMNVIHSCAFESFFFVHCSNACKMNRKISSGIIGSTRDFFICKEVKHISFSLEFGFVEATLILFSITDIPLSYGLLPLGIFFA